MTLLVAPKATFQPVFWAKTMRWRSEESYDQCLGSWHTALSSQIFALPMTAPLSRGIRLIAVRFTQLPPTRLLLYQADPERLRLHSTRYQ